MLTAAERDKLWSLPKAMDLGVLPINQQPRKSD